MVCLCVVVSLSAHVVAAAGRSVVLFGKAGQLVTPLTFPLRSHEQNLDLQQRIVKRVAGYARVVVSDYVSK